MVLPRMVVTGPGVLEQIPAIIAELDIPERGLIVCDTNTSEINKIKGLNILLIIVSKRNFSISYF